MKYRIERHDPSQVDRLWPDVEAKIAVALDKRPLVLGIKDVYQGLTTGGLHLWTVKNETGDIIAAATTQVLFGQLGKSLLVITCGGEGMDEWIGDFTVAWSTFAKAMGCHSIIEIGRKGWTRVLKRHGWQEYATSMIKVLQ